MYVQTNNSQIEFDVTVSLESSLSQELHNPFASRAEFDKQLFFPSIGAGISVARAHVSSFRIGTELHKKYLVIPRKKVNESSASSEHYEKENTIFIMSHSLSAFHSLYQRGVTIQVFYGGDISLFSIEKRRELRNFKDAINDIDIHTGDDLSRMLFGYHLGLQAMFKIHKNKVNIFFKYGKSQEDRLKGRKFYIFESSHLGLRYYF